MTAATAAATSDDILKSKYDRCIANFTIKTGVGLCVGVAGSFLLFKRKRWPVALSTGFGSGFAYSDCISSFKNE